jgi:hypothetical protein
MWASAVDEVVPVFTIIYIVPMTVQLTPSHKVYHGILNTPELEILNNH